MPNSRTVWYGFVSVVLVLGVILGVSSCKSKDEGPAGATSAENLFAIQVNNFEYTLGQVDQYLTGVSPVPMGLRMLVRMQLAGLLGSPELPGLDMNGSFTAFGVVLSGYSEDCTAGSKVFFGGLIPVTDYEKFVGNPSFMAADENGVSAMSIVKPKPGGPATTEDCGKIAGGSKILVTALGDFALVSSSDQYDKLLQYRNLMASKISSSTEAVELASVSDLAQAQQLSKEPIYIYGNIQAVSKAFGPMLFKKIEEMKAAMSDIGSGIDSSIEKLEETKIKMAEMGSDKAKIAEFERQIQELKEQQKKVSVFGSQETLGNIVNMYVVVIKKLLNEGQSLSVSIKPSSEVLHFATTLSAVADSNMAELFTRDESGEEGNDLLGYLEDGAVANFAFKMDRPFWKKLMVKGVDLFYVFSGESMASESKAKLTKLTIDSIDSLGGPVAGTFSVDMTRKPPFVAKYIASVDDVDKFNHVIEESDVFFRDSGILDFYKGLGIEIEWDLKRNSDSYKGVSIDSAKFLIKAIDPNHAMSEMIEKMYGEGFDYRWGIVDGLCVVAVSGDVDSVIRELIDRVKSGEEQEIPSEVKEAMSYLPGSAKADFFVTYNYIRLFKMMGALMSGIPGAESGMSAIDIPSTSNLCLSGTSGGGKMVVEAALPKEHMGELVSAIMLFRQQMQVQNSVFQTKEKLKILHSAVLAFQLDTGRLPSEEEGLIAMVENPSDVSNWADGGYLSGAYVPKDNWGRDFIYEVDPGGGVPFVVISYGADGKEGGDGANADLLSSD